jgi:hypothetical protein
MRSRWLHALLLVCLIAPSSQAGVLFGRKKDRPDPKTRVPELLAALKDDKDADKRAKAAEELRLYDPAVFPEIVPSLIAALQGDASAGVRIEAAHSLSKLRPVSQAVGEALEQSVAKDASMRVRLQSRNALLQYHWAGYRGKKTDVPPLNATREPPLVEDKGPPAISTTPPGRPTVIVPPAQAPSWPYNSPRLTPPPPDKQPTPEKDKGKKDKGKGKDPELELPPVKPEGKSGKPEARPMPSARQAGEGPELD